MHSRRKNKTGGRNKKNKMRSKTRKLKRTKRTRRTKRTKRSRRSRMRGGNTMSPFIGAPYNAAAPHPTGNYLKFNSEVENLPEQSNVILNDRGMQGPVRAGGGRKQRGGGMSNFISTILPDEAVNIGRSIPAAFTRAYNNFSGVSHLPSSYVYPTQQPPTIDILSPKMSPPDILGMYNTANTQVARI